MNCVFNLPDLALWSTTVGRWIHDDCIVMITAADFALYEFDTVINQPADRCVAESGRNSIFFCPCNHSLGCIYVCNTCSGCGSRSTVLGTGDIGSSFARRVKAMGAKTVVGVSRSGRHVDDAYDAMYTTTQLDQVLPETEILAMALPGTAETEGILSRSRIALLPKEAVVVNVGRGTAIDQDALMEALNAGRLAGAALDVVRPEPLPPEHPLWNTKNLLLTPHLSGFMSLGITRDTAVALFCEDFENYIAGRPLKRLVDRRKGY